MELLSYKKIRQDLGQFLQFCSLIGLKEERGRFTQYHHTIAALMDAIETHSLSGQGEEQWNKYHVALLEGMEASFLLPYLQQCDPVAIFPKIRDCLKGTFKMEEENPRSNRPRNIQFELFLASKLWQAGFPPVLGEHPDLKCQVKNKWFFFECKRLFSTSPQMLGNRIRESADQIQKALRKAPPETRGIIAISLERILNPSQDARQILNEQQGRDEMDMWLCQKALEVIDVWDPLSDEKIVAILFYAASPFDNFEAGFYTPGRFFKGFYLTQTGSPDDIAVRKLGEAMKAIQY